VVWGVSGRLTYVSVGQAGGVADCEFGTGLVGEEHDAGEVVVAKRYNCVQRY
jgi:hypothetical protein